MLGAIHRVVSGGDVPSTTVEQQQQQQQQQTGDDNNNMDTTDSGANQNSAMPPAMLVEPDPGDPTEYSDHDAPLEHLMADRNTSDTFTTSSSLSDGSCQEDGVNDPMMAAKGGQVDVYMEDALFEQPPTPLAGVGSGPHHHQYYPASAATHYQQQLMNTQQQQQKQKQQRVLPERMDSSDDDEDSGSARATTRSENSSRDWGWFEDVHQSGQLTPTERSLSNRGGKSGVGGGKARPVPKHHKMVVGLDPRDETAAAAMAVTAPTYVLEESMSSQRLWKDTAGNRPPQPVEERAFYEKMWAQNFARSQVNYQMPVEVLTATSPISLSPFAEGGTMEISPAAAAAGDGGNFQQYNMNVNTPANTHNMMMMPSSVTKSGEGGTSAAAGGAPSAAAGGGGASLVGAGGLKEEPRPAPPTVLPPTHHQHIVNKTAKTESGDNLTVLVRGDNVFGTTVSKSFACTDEKGGPVTGVDTVNISIASYRVVESRKNGKYAQFLVIYREGSIRDTIGVWKRYSDFDDLAKKVTQAHEGCASVIANMSPLAITEEHDVEHLPNAITSWRLLKKRQRWYRCLDAGYLSLKVFLLERFLHDILFESSSPKLLREFVGSTTE